jgi:soluble cytochrome b562
MAFLLQCEVLREDITKTRSRIAELQVQANEETEHKQETVEELKGVETCLQELQSSLAESNKTHDEFILKVTREKCETDEELKNAEHGLQSSIVSHDCMLQVRNRVCFFWQYTSELCSRNVFFCCVELADYIVTLSVAKTI